MGGVHQLDSGSRRDFEQAGGAGTAVRDGSGRTSTEVFRCGRGARCDTKFSDGGDQQDRSARKATLSRSLWMSAVREREDKRCATGRRAESSVIAPAIIPPATIARRRSLSSVNTYLYPQFLSRIPSSLSPYDLCRESTTTHRAQLVEPLLVSHQSSQSAIHPPFIGNRRLELELRNWRWGWGFCDLRHSPQGARGRKWPGAPRNRTTSPGVLFIVGTATKSNLNPSEKWLTSSGTNH